MTLGAQGRDGTGQIDEAYEALRADVLRVGEPTGGRLGQAVVHHRGVGAWVVAWRSLTSAGRPVVRPRPRSEPIPHTAEVNAIEKPTVPRAEAARLLASMVLSNLEGSRA